MQTVTSNNKQLRAHSIVSQNFGSSEEKENAM